MLLATAACSSTTVDAVTMGGQGGQGGSAPPPDAARDGAPTGDRPGGLSCPSIVPLTDQPCPDERLVCDVYDDDPRDFCRSRASCGADLTWKSISGDCAPLPDVQCPATREAAAGQACDTKDALCSYEQDLACRCTNCPAGSLFCTPAAPLEWSCNAPHMDPQCPPGQPRLGSPCTPEGKRCAYECGSGGARLCRKGLWFPDEGDPCPISTIKAKKDVAYLAKREKEQIARQLLALPLASYEYRDPARAGRRHLGFIIEDAPDIFAVDGRASMVDLYGYASMLVATTQIQQEQIARLERKLKAVERTLKNRACAAPERKGSRAR